ncbi:MAG TPA: site-specific DNA-methyltransferase, partial [Planctomycetes bacterium]|nr:site-specific DNA-methyltransferase [Planctomycetota bacterium]
DYHGQFEPIIYGWKPGAAHYFIDDRTQTTVWEYPKPQTSKEHPTMKPTPLTERCIKNSSKRGWLVYDPFLGSGTTLIAADNLGRKCYGMEIDPGYCDVIVERWENLTGGKAVRHG